MPDDTVIFKIKRNILSSPTSQFFFEYKMMESIENKGL